MALDIARLFNEQLPGALARNEKEARTIDATYQLNITGAGFWHIDLTARGPRIEAGEKPADCTVTIAAEDFEKLKENPALGVQLFFSGRLRVSGNRMLGLKLQKLFSFK